MNWRPGALDATCCRTDLLFQFLAIYAGKARLDSREALALSHLKNAAFRVHQVAHMTGGFSVPCAGHPDLEVTSTGIISNFQEVVRCAHGTFQSAWKLQWDSMTSSGTGLLSTSWDEPSTFLDVLLFLTLVAKTRRKQAKHSWTKHKSGELVCLLLTSVVDSLAHVLHLYYWQIHAADPANQSEEAENIPARRLRQGRGLVSG